jgi:hypothetical protein
MADDIIKIKHPTPNGKTLCVPFVVSGYACQTILRVTGVVNVLDGSYPPITGTPLRFTQKQTHTDLPNQWVWSWAITFDQSPITILKDGTQCTVQVTGFDANNNSYTSPAVPFTIQGCPSARSRVEGKAEIIDTGGLAPGDITTEAGDFTPYGSITSALLVSATMNDVAATYIYSDPGSGYWYAQFPPLGAGTYTLLVVDNTNFSAAVTGLVVA